MATIRSLPSLQSFSDTEQPEPEAFGAALTDESINEVRCYCTPELQESAELYARINGLTGKMRTLIVDQMPHEEMADMDREGTVPIFLSDATDSDLRHRFFSNPGVIHFADHNLVRDGERDSSLKLTTVGTTPHGINQLPRNIGDIDVLRKNRSDAMKRILGSDVFTYVELRELLRSGKGGFARLHALGPNGTNIAQASRMYLDQNDIRNGAEVHVHGNKIEPMRYADIAAQEADGRNMPLHMECAVYYQMGDLYRTRMAENVFADQQYMKLDEMQLATMPDRTLERGNGAIKIASHPSPQALVRQWLDTGDAEYIKASSNSDAADMVVKGEVDACITTESGRATRELDKVHSFGSPTMMFTVGTPYSMQQLHKKMNG